MKKFESSLLIISGLILYVVLVSCVSQDVQISATVIEPVRSELLLGAKEPDIKGVIVELFMDENQVIGIYVEGSETDNYQYNQAVVGIRAETNIFSAAGDQIVLSSPQDLLNGQMVEVLFKPGTIKEKHPISARALEIVILSGDVLK